MQFTWLTSKKKNKNKLLTDGKMILFEKSSLYRNNLLLWICYPSYIRGTCNNIQLFYWLILGF